MTFTRHLHHIPGSTTDNELHEVEPVNCGGPLICESCKFECSWFRDFDEKKATIFPSEVESLDSVILKKIAAKIREKNPEPHNMMLIRKYHVAAAIHALANAIDGVAEDMSKP